MLLISDSLTSSPLAVALNPTLDEEVIQEVMVDTPEEPESAEATAQPSG